MAFIAREDGTHFVIPSYRDTLTAKNAATLKKEILLLSQSYGNYITLQKRSPIQFEIAFSTETGYLLGESIWHHFKRPMDMVYCEAIPNTTEAILVIVKSGTVYLDGSFQLESIPEELIIFLTQQNNFDIYVYGDVPISKEHEAGKFSFEANSVRNFTVLNNPAFPIIPLLKIYQLQTVDIVLKEHGIGVFPIAKVLGGIIALGLLWAAYSYLTAPKEIVKQIMAPPPPPLLGYMNELTTPAPIDEFKQILIYYHLLMTLPGWHAAGFTYIKGGFSAGVTSHGGTMQGLLQWSEDHKVTLDIQKNGIVLAATETLNNRPVPTKIYPIKQLMAVMIDKMGRLYPGNHISIDTITAKGAYTDVKMTINFENFSPAIVMLLAQEMNDLPLNMVGATIRVDQGLLSGTIVFDVLGSS